MNPRAQKIKSKPCNKLLWGPSCYGYHLLYYIHLPTLRKSALQPFQICSMLRSFILPYLSCIVCTSVFSFSVNHLVNFYSLNPTLMAPLRKLCFALRGSIPTPVLSWQRSSWCNYLLGPPSSRTWNYSHGETTSESCLYLYWFRSQVI